MSESTVQCILALVTAGRLDPEQARSILDDALTTLEQRRRELAATQARVAIALSDLDQLGQVPGRAGDVG